MNETLMTLVGMVVLYAPLALIALVVGFACFIRIMPLLASKQSKTA
ncbi:hypothetical protein ACN4EK_27925 [Pantanalinema rosaneae CENA516]